MSWLDLESKNFAVTGAASGIGFSIAKGLVEAGANIAILDYDWEGANRAAEDLSKYGNKPLALNCDTSNKESVVAAAEQFINKFGSCNGLVNNAGVLKSAALDSLDINEWNQVLSINLTGYLQTAKAFYPYLCKQDKSSLVHIASISGSFPQTHSGAYSSSKAGVILLSRQIAVEWGSKNIRSNTVCPGMIRTSLSADFYAIPGIEAKRAAMTASKRVGEPEDIANTVLFLLSEKSDYINAADISVNGGMDAMLMDMVPRPGYNDDEKEV